MALLASAPAKLPAYVCGGHAETPDPTADRLLVAHELARDITLLRGQNTWDECRTIVPVLPRRSLLVTSSSHALRAMLTMVQALTLADKQRSHRVWLACCAGIDADWDAECTKVGDYQKLGHMASFEDGLNYLRWRDDDAP